MELLFEVIFTVADRLIGNAGLSIIFLSLAVNFLVLPLYKRADELQAEERDIQAKMAARLKQIKSTFKGDERFFMIQEYYRRYTVNNVTMDMSTIDQRRHYHVNMATYLELGKWLDYLRANDVYDNTRIILVADHGRCLNQFGISCNNQDLECFMPLLMVKDLPSTKIS